MINRSSSEHLLRHFLARALRALRPAVATVFISVGSIATAAPNPLKVLLVTGGCCHDYATQKDILKRGLEARANVVVKHAHTSDKSRKPPLPILGNPRYADGYDVVIHDECGADITEAALAHSVVKPHLDGLPGVNLHCAMHSYRSKTSIWFEYLGLISTGHGPQKPITVTFLDRQHPITRNVSDWTTGNEELYNNIMLFPSAHALAYGRQQPGEKKQAISEGVVAWTNEYGPKKTRVFSTTIGHNSATVEDPRYLDLVVRGLLWACGKLDKDGKPVAGYGPQGT